MLWWTLFICFTNLNLRLKYTQNFRQTCITFWGFGSWRTVAWFTYTLHLRLAKFHHLTNAKISTLSTTKTAASWLLCRTSIPMIFSWVIKACVQVIELENMKKKSEIYNETQPTFLFCVNIIKYMYHSFCFASVHVYMIKTGFVINSSMMICNRPLLLHCGTGSWYSHQISQGWSPEGSLAWSNAHPFVASDWHWGTYFDLRLTL